MLGLWLILSMEQQVFPSSQLSQLTFISADMTFTFQNFKCSVELTGLPCFALCCSRRCSAMLLTWLCWQEKYLQFSTNILICVSHTSHHCNTYSS
jgi:hypothetical protein